MTVFPINTGWRYSEEVSPGSTQPEFDDTEWRRVCVPHANRIVPWHGFDEHDLQFVSVYRRRFTLPDGAAGRVFLDFDGVLSAAIPVINGVRLTEHRGGYVPFSYEISEHVRWDEENVLAVIVDSTERADIPPFGGRVDYLGFGGIYRDVGLRIVPEVFVTEVVATPVRVLDPRPGVEVEVVLDASGDWPGDDLDIEVALHQGDDVLATVSGRSGPLDPGVAGLNLVLDAGPIQLWDLDRPALYDVVVQLRQHGRLLDEHTVRIGFREAVFTPDGFVLNGRRVKLRGLNRHQSFPFLGAAMPARGQRKDAEIIKNDLRCNVVRTSHYPQSPQFLDRCDELGLLVIEEIPGWQHIGDDAWKDLACRDVEAMIRRDRHRPSVVMWGVRINESADDREFYLRTNQIAKALDSTRPTGGTRDFAVSELLEDVFTINDFAPDRLRPPNHPHYLNTEFAGHTFPTKQSDNVERVQEHLLRHALILDQLESDDRYAGGLAWCAFDYNTHAYSGSGDGVCYHGVADIFRVPKPVAALYSSQCDPAEDIVLEPAFHWATGELHWQVLEFHRSMAEPSPWGGGPGHAVICSNCDVLRIWFGDQLVAELEPDRKTFKHLAHPPFVTDALARSWGTTWQDLRIDGYVDDRLVATRWLSGSAADTHVEVTADDAELDADGRDATRIVFRVTDEYGNRRPYATGAITFTVDGPGQIVGESPFALVGGSGAVWLRSTDTAGSIHVTVTHPTLGSRTIIVEARPIPREKI